MPEQRPQAGPTRARRTPRERVRAGQRRSFLPVRRSSEVWPSCSLRAPRARSRCACRLPPVAGASVDAGRCAGRSLPRGLYSIWPGCCRRTQRAALRRGARLPDLWTALAFDDPVLRGTFAGPLPSCSAAILSVAPPRLLRKHPPHPAAAGTGDPSQRHLLHCRLPPRVTSRSCSAPRRFHAVWRARGPRQARPRAGCTGHPGAPETMSR